jgi:hypothetical protein
MSWVVGSNYPGYLPESEVDNLDNWYDAKDELFYRLHDGYESTLTAIEREYQQAIEAIRNAELERPIDVNFQQLHYWVNSNTEEEDGSCQRCGGEGCVACDTRKLPRDDELPAPGPGPHPTTPAHGRTAETPS